MADVACFCGCLFCFDGDAGACPGCGEVASVTGLAVPGSSGYSRPGTPDADIRQLSGVPVSPAAIVRADFPAPKKRILGAINDATAWYSQVDIGKL
jgi:hypothetical protein